MIVKRRPFTWKRLWLDVFAGLVLYRYPICCVSHFCYVAHVLRDAPGRRARLRGYRTFGRRHVACPLCYRIEARAERAMSLRATIEWRLELFETSGFVSTSELTEWLQGLQERDHRYSQEMHNELTEVINLTEVRIDGMFDRNYIVDQTAHVMDGWYEKARP